MWLQLDSNPEKRKHSTIWLNWPNSWVFVYKLSGSGSKSSCSHLNFRFHACFEQGVPWHSGNDRVSTHSEMHLWPYNNDVTTFEVDSMVWNSKIWKNGLKS